MLRMYLRPIPLALTLLLAGVAALLLPTTLPAQTAGDDPFAKATGEGAAADDPFAKAASDPAGGGLDAGGFGGGGFGAGQGGLPLGGFIMFEHAHHIGPDGVQERDIVLSNVRGRLKAALTGDSASAYLKVDFLRDEVRDATEVALREARVQWTPLRWMDINVGMQVSTWGVGDMVFINDLFPKNWIANFTGQDLEFLKEPASAVRVSLYPGPLTWDVVYTPQFAPDVVPSGCRFAVFDPNTQALTASAAACGSDANLPPEGTGESADGELALRLMGNLGPMQVALYGYRGFWKSPRGVLWIDTTGAPVVGTPNPALHDLAPYHPRMEAWGVSLEGQTGPGILAIEAGRYRSVDDADGSNPLIENSVRKALLGYRLDFSASLSGGLQWMVESMEDYDAYLTSFTAGAVQPRAEQRDTFTLRLTYKARQDTLYVHFFGYHRPDDQDGLYKLWLTQRVDDHLEVSGGANVFTGADGYEDREFGMLRDGDNAFVRFTYNF